MIPILRNILIGTGVSLSLRTHSEAETPVRVQIMHDTIERLRKLGDPEAIALVRATQLAQMSAIGKLFGWGPVRIQESGLYTGTLTSAQPMTYRPYVPIGS